MTNGLWSIGSVTDYIGALVGWSNIPSGISGTTLSNMVEQELNFIELFSTIVIDSNAIPEPFQPVVIDLVNSKLLLAITSNNGGLGDISLGELSIGAGVSSYSEISKQLREDAMARMKELQRTLRFKRVIGGIQ